jgi:putative oxidoreductase
MKRIVIHVVRSLLGLVFLAAGIVGLFNLVPPPEDLPEGLQAFNAGLMATGYFFPFLKATEAVCGALLLMNKFVPFALVVLAPIVINITLVHAFLAIEGLPLALILGAMTFFLAFFAEPYNEAIKRLFASR